MIGQWDLENTSKKGDEQSTTIKFLYWFVLFLAEQAIMAVLVHTQVC